MVLEAQEDKVEIITLFCKYCGKEFQAEYRKNHTRLYCSFACKRKSNTKMQTDRRRSSKEECPTKFNTELDIIAAEARKEGLSYGQYVAKYNV